MDTQQTAWRPSSLNGSNYGDGRGARDIEVERRLTMLEIDGDQSRKRLDALERSGRAMSEAVWKFTRGAAALMGSVLIYQLLHGGGVMQALRAKLGF